MNKAPLLMAMMMLVALLSPLPGFRRRGVSLRLFVSIFGYAFVTIPLTGIWFVYVDAGAQYVPNVAPTSGVGASFLAAAIGSGFGFAAAVGLSLWRSPGGGSFARSHLAYVVILLWLAGLFVKRI